MKKGLAELRTASACVFSLPSIGDNVKALERFNAALQLAVHHSNYMLRVDMPEIVEPSMSTVRQTINWGAPKRNTALARLPDSMLVLQGQANPADNNLSRPPRRRRLMLAVDRSRAVP